MRFCLIGVGRAGLVHAKNIVHSIKNAELVALCDSNKDTLEQVARDLGQPKIFLDYHVACTDQSIDAVIIVTPTHLHCDIACCAAESGKHIFLEKPMAITVDECRAINQAVKKSGVTLQIGFMRRFDQSFMKAKEILDSGEMGRILTIKSTGRGPGLPPPWIYDIRKSNGILAEVNSHDFDSVRWLAGSDIQRVYAEAGNFKCLDAQSKWPEFYDNAIVSLRFENGTLGIIDGTCPAGYGYDARVEILCERGVLFIGSSQNHGLEKITLEGEIKGEAVKSWRNLFREAYVDEMKHFIECAQAGKEPRVSGIDGMKAVEAVVAANRSILEKRAVCLSE